MGERIRAPWLRKDVRGYIPGTTQQVGGDIINLRTRSADWGVRINCIQDPAACPVIQKNTAPRMQNRMCEAYNIAPERSGMYVPANGVWCGKTEIGKRNVKEADASHMTVIEEAPAPVIAPPGSTSCNPYAV